MKGNFPDHFLRPILLSGAEAQEPLRHRHIFKCLYSTEQREKNERKKNVTKKVSLCVGESKNIFRHELSLRNEYLGMI